MPTASTGGKIAAADGYAWPVRPNVILIVFDTARADALEPYGAPPGSSPAVADLARRGSALPAMFAPACWTVPSHSSMFTGLLPRANGLIRAPGGRPRGARPVLERHRDRLLPEVFRRAGYATRGVSTNLWLTERSGFDIGFERFVEVETRRQAQLSGDDWRERTRWALEGIRARADDGAREALAVVRDWLSERRDGDPFFWFVNLIECHSPYLPPRPYNDLGVLDRWRAAEEAREHLTLGAIWRACAGGFDVPDDALERMRHLYAGAIRALDDWLAAVLALLDERGLLDETLVIVTSDHGENLGEGGLMGHAFSLDDRLLHVPCVVAGPGAFAPREAQGLAALPRLIAEAVALDAHPWANGLPTGGVAVAQFDPPSGRGDPRVAEALAAWGLGAEAAPRITTPYTVATDGRWKLMLRGDREELYDLEGDSLEAEPLSPDSAPVPAPALQALRAAVADASASGAEPSTEGPEEISDEERRKLEERMRLLGYL